jgi:hypothetical protein
MVVQQILTEEELLRRTVAEVVSLPGNDLALVLEFVDYLRQRDAHDSAQLSFAEIRAIARERARTLQGVPRHELVRRFTEVSERIRAQAIAAGTAIEGDWQGD